MFVNFNRTFDNYHKLLHGNGGHTNVASPQSCSSTDSCLTIICNKINVKAYLNQPIPERMHDILADRACVYRAILHSTTKKQLHVRYLAITQLQQLEWWTFHSQLLHPYLSGATCFLHYGSPSQTFHMPTLNLCNSIPTFKDPSVHRFVVYLYCC